MSNESLTNSMGKITLFALPIAASSLVNILGNFISMLFLARLGRLELAAAVLAFFSYITISSVGFMTINAVSILVSHAKEGKLEKIPSIVINGFCLAILLAVGIALILWHFDKLLLWLGQDPKLVAIAKGYFHYNALAMLPMMLVVTAAQFYIGIGKPQVSLVISVLRLPIIIVSAYAFVLGKWGLPQCGLTGVAIASFITQIVTLVVLLVYFPVAGIVKKYQIFSRRAVVSLYEIKKILFLGLPIGAQFVGELAAVTVASYFMGYLGINALAASQIVTQFVTFIIMVFFGLTQALSVLVSRYYAQKNMLLIKQYVIAASFV
ncbi:MAG: MATE family efflux transporter, partial [Pseudomonadota bacterium]